MAGGAVGDWEGRCANSLTTACGVVERGEYEIGDHALWVHLESSRVVRYDHERDEPIRRRCARRAHAQAQAVLHPPAMQGPWQRFLTGNWRPCEGSGISGDGLGSSWRTQPAPPLPRQRQQSHRPALGMRAPDAAGFYQQEHGASTSASRLGRAAEALGRCCPAGGSRLLLSRAPADAHPLAPATCCPAA